MQWQSVARDEEERCHVVQVAREVHGFSRVGVRVLKGEGSRVGRERPDGKDWFKSSATVGWWNERNLWKNIEKESIRPGDGFYHHFSTM